MKPDFIVYRSRARTIFIILFGLFFGTIGLLVSGIINPFYFLPIGPDVEIPFRVGITPFSVVGILFLIIGLGIVLYNAYLLFTNPSVLIAKEDQIVFSKDSYPVEAIKQFQILSYYSRNRDDDAMHFREYLLINGHRGQKKVNIRNKRINTEKLIDELNLYYPDIPIEFVY